MDETACIKKARLVAFLWSMMGSFDDARDVAQEAFIQAYVHLADFDMEKNFKTWLFGIALNRGIDWLRRKKSFWNFFRRESEKPERSVLDHIDEGKIEDSPIFQPLLQKISPQERAALILKFNEGYKAAEIGQLLGCSETTVRVHLFNAKRKLRREVCKSIPVTACPACQKKVEIEADWASFFVSPAQVPRDLDLWPGIEKELPHSRVGVHAEKAPG